MSTQPVTIPTALEPPHANASSGALPGAARPPVLRAGVIAVALLAVAIGLWLGFGRARKPDVLSAPMDKVLDYTLLTEDFNKLPLDERLVLIQDLVSRFKTMSGDDSVLMAAFAANIRGAARKQMERNAALIALDVWDKYARLYRTVPEARRGEYLDQTFLELDKLTEAISGEPNNKTDAERLADGRRQAKRDADMFSSGKGPTGGQLARMAQKMRGAALNNGSPQQIQRAQQLMLDMTVHLRSQDGP